MGATYQDNVNCGNDFRDRSRYGVTSGVLDLTIRMLTRTYGMMANLGLLGRLPTAPLLGDWVVREIVSLLNNLLLAIVLIC